MERIKTEPEEQVSSETNDDLDDLYDNFDDYPSDMDLDFTEHPYIRDEVHRGYPDEG